MTVSVPVSIMAQAYLICNRQLEGDTSNGLLAARVQATFSWIFKSAAIGF